MYVRYMYDCVYVCMSCHYNMLSSYMSNAARDRRGRYVSLFRKFVSPTSPSSATLVPFGAYYYHHLIKMCKGCCCLIVEFFSKHVNKEKKF